MATGCSRLARPGWSPSREPGPPPAWPPAIPSTSGFDSVPAMPIGGPGRYVNRPGFAHGGAGVAACWYGGARAWAGPCWPRRPNATSARTRWLTSVRSTSRCITAKTGLDQAADEIDADPDDRADRGRLRALRVRAQVEAVATEVMHRVGRALQHRPLCRDEAHSRRVADLTVYLRQHHAERDLAALRRPRGRKRYPVVTPQAGAKPNRIDQPGTAAAAWAAWPRLRRLPSADPRAWASAVVISGSPGR